MYKFSVQPSLKEKNNRKKIMKKAIIIIIAICLVCAMNLPTEVRIATDPTASTADEILFRMVVAPARWDVYHLGVIKVAHTNYRPLRGMVFVGFPFVKEWHRVL